MFSVSGGGAGGEPDWFDRLRGLGALGLIGLAMWISRPLLSENPPMYVLVVLGVALVALALDRGKPRSGGTDQGGADAE